MSNTLSEEKLTISQSDRTYKILLGLSLALLVVGFAGPWVYAPLGKSTNWGWQPIWGFLLSLIEANVFIVVSIGSCFSYVELFVRQARPPLEALLKWIGGFFGLLVVVPLVAWLLVDMRQTSPTPANPEGTLGWGVWVALLGLVLQVVALRWRIRQIRRTAANS